MVSRQLSRRALIAAAGAGLLAGCTARPGSELRELVLATGPDGAVFQKIGGAIATLLARALPGVTIRARPSSASVENLHLLNRGEAQLALSSLDAISEHPNTSIHGISAVGRLYDSFLHLVVPAGGPIRRFDDLAGKRVSVGAGGSGTEFIVANLRRVTGASFTPVLFNQQESALALARGSLDAFFTLTGIPTPAITDLEQHTNIRLVPLVAQAQALARLPSGYYLPATIPATTYGAIPPCPTVVTPNLLLARDDVPDDVVEIVTRTVFVEAPTIAADRPEARRINIRTGISTGPIPLHSGAARWFRAVKG
ncbi:TAXI family TRAP transporter solute-binding subunit [Allokutzneria sp. A3M-2-11 16]|uniref:TAXI family TRAP transporter solute-binding subunit n=1 Tax=Allokutzneria sp. A3M-2-11 16 TaxID=2962043 RepID=UPI0020B6A633|nr:TAXI family TRAP transporter solute-binding subunit [Allokutzneria sp. A3M-2-11 16]MCP3797672.1 TAXI family TRAP transporter solute-binding subunit [Allokutzneria sp. A3M-2-11 16]